MRCARMAFPIALLLSLAGVVAAQSGGTFSLRRSTVDGGGGQSSAGPLVLVGTVGQHDADYSASGALSLRGGFWAAPRAPANSLFSDGFE